MTAARVKLSHITEQITQSSAGEQYRLLISALKALLERAHSHLADQRAVRAMTELLSRKGNEYMVKLAWLDPFIRSLPKDKVMLISISLTLGFIAGKLCAPSVPSLKPTYMLSSVCGSYSGVLGVAQCRIPVPRVQNSSQVLVKVMSTSLDLTDVLSVSGWGRVERRRMHGGFTIGRDFCGVVLEVGDRVAHIQPGDRVWGAVPYNLPGTLSEMLVLADTHVERMPNNLNWDGAATVPYSALMVWDALVWRGKLRPDKSEGVRVLVVDGVTDTGCLATQLACLWSCMVTVLCPARTVPLAHALGAHTVIAARESADECVQDLLEDAGPFDLVVVAGDLVPSSACSPLLAEKGRICSTLPPSLSSDGWGVMRRLFLPLWRALVLPPSVPSQRRLAQPLRYMTAAVESGKIQPVLDSVISPLDIKRELTRLVTAQTVGKSVVVFDKI